ncbi:hypothetical protein Pmani_015894 [Petrolisthes manimaculis]|uniref:RUN domain-containing protein n=1 Tax=Petrolisthes manimaculis TaxID=1843537 RepID=A0AAE1UBL5_9EUCA|nr:hypothetical protein Pmani_015894 [Petrolisthes manimaculis]
MFSQRMKRERREDAIRSSLLTRMKEAVQSVVQPGESTHRYTRHTSSPPPSGGVVGPVLGHSDNTNALCNILEGVLVHGLRDSLGERMSALLGSDPDRMPVPNFWPVLLVISHRDIIEQVTELCFISSEVGRSRAWVRLALNTGQICSYLSVLIQDSRILNDYYKPTSFLRDYERADMMINILQPVSSLTFCLATNAAVLNTWTQTPLVLAGLWAPMIEQHLASEPILAATDVASTVRDDRDHNTDTDNIPSSPVTDQMFELIIGGTPETSFIKDYMHNNTTTTTTTQQHNNTTTTNNEEANTEYARHARHKNTKEDYTRIFSDNVFTDGFNIMRPDSLGEAFSPNSPHTSNTPSVEHSNESSPSEVAEKLNYEVLPRELPSDEDMSRLLPLLTRLTNEQGLDSQLYQCYQCKAYIGMIYGKPRLCWYDARYYCPECHVGGVEGEGEGWVVPARVVHNWDFTRYPVCRPNALWLTAVHHRPLINLRTVNARLYCHVDDLAELQDLQQVANGLLVGQVREAVTFGREHISACEVCSARGFFCELCDDNKVIYPFQLGDTYTCVECYGVYHRVCSRRLGPCPRCVRRAARREIDTQHNTTG